jgi:hypothetical protein
VGQITLVGEFGCTSYAFHILRMLSRGEELFDLEGILLIEEREKKAIEKSAKQEGIMSAHCSN